MITWRWSQISVSPGRTIRTGPLTDLYSSRIDVTGGENFSIAALNYTLYSDWRTHLTLFSADGAGSLLNLASLKSITVPGAWDQPWVRSVTANNGGIIDLSGLETVSGSEYDTYNNNDWLEFVASSGGVTKLGNASFSRRARISTSGRGAMLDCRGMYLRWPVTLSVGNKAMLRSTGNFAFENTDNNSIVVEDAYFQMDGAQPQRLEVGGRDSGPSGFTSRNFGYSQLLVGSSNQTSVVRLVDTLNNGGRGAAGEPEALYLYGMDGAGLRILNGSRLILNGLNAYAAVSGQMRSLRSLIPAGSNSVAFDGGFIAIFGGPRITNMTPSVAVTPAVSSVDVAFDLPIAAASFTPADVSITGPGGSIAASSVTPGVGNTWQISLAAQSTDGTYIVRVGPAINELAANLAGMDQNGDRLSGDGTNDTLVGTFVIDGTAPVVAGAYALQNGTRIGVTFSEPMVASFATNPANYSVNGAAPTGLLLANNNQVVLNVNPLAGVGFTLVVSNAVDALGNQTNRSYAGTILPMVSSDIGVPGSDPREPGWTVPWNAGDLNVVAGGSTIWNTQDAGHSAYESRTGDFDVRVRLALQTTPSQWTQSGLMARPSLNRSSRFVYLFAQSRSDANSIAPTVRPSDGVNVNGWGSSSSGVPLPNAWMRLRRQGDVFSAYRSTNGVDSISLGTLTQTMPATLLVGMAGSANNNNAGQTSTSWYRDYSDVSPSLLTRPQS